MSELLRKINVRVVGVSFKNEDGSSRQKIISDLVEGESVSLEYYTYEGKPAYAVTSVDGQIGNLPKDLSADISQKYFNCFFDAFVDRILGGYDGLKYGCVIQIDIYDHEPEYLSAPDSETPVLEAPDLETPVQPQNSELSIKENKFYGWLYTILGIISLPVFLLFSLLNPIIGLIGIAVSIFLIIVGHKRRKIAKQIKDNQT